MNTIDILNEGLKKKYLNENTDIEDFQCVLDKNYLYDYLTYVEDDLTALFDGTVSNTDELYDIFEIKRGRCYLLQGTVLSYHHANRYYDYFKINNTDKVIGILHEEYASSALSKFIERAWTRWFRS